MTNHNTVFALVPAVTRGAALRLATAGVIAGIAAAASAGTAAAAPAAPLPTFTDGQPGLGSLLLDDFEVGRVVGARNLREDKSGYRLGNLSVTPAHCISAYAPFQADAYTGTDPQDVAYKIITDGRGKNLLVSEGVIELPSKRYALDHMEATFNAWDACQGRTVTSDGQSWTMDAPRVNEDRTIVTLGQTHSDGRSTCERAIASYREVFIDVMTCTTGRADGQAVAIIEAIAEKANSQPL